MIDVELFNAGQEKRILAAYLCYTGDLLIYPSAQDSQYE
jgi:hypothetical protein